jgi:hypothetical protein
LYSRFKFYIFIFASLVKDQFISSTCNANNILLCLFLENLGLAKVALKLGICWEHEIKSLSLFFVCVWSINWSTITAIVLSVFLALFNLNQHNIVTIMSWRVSYRIRYFLLLKTKELVKYITRYGLIVIIEIFLNV